MAEWPVTLPNPMENSEIVFGTNMISSTTQSGTVSSVRYGSGAPDMLKLKFRLFFSHSEHGNQVSTFLSFFNNDLNLGTNWFSASWLSDLWGYADFKCKFTSRPEKEVESLTHIDISVDAITKQASACSIDETWG